MRGHARRRGATGCAVLDIGPDEDGRPAEVDERISDEEGG